MIDEILVGVGVLVMFIGAAAADGDLRVAAALILIGAIGVLLGRKSVEERYGTDRDYDCD